MKWVYRGNFGVPFSTESHVAASIELLGHSVERVQENDTGWAETAAACEDADIFLWTATHGYSLQWPDEEAVAAIEQINRNAVSCSLHLDLFWSLERAEEGKFTDRPFFRNMRHVFTADGDHDEDWRQYGVNHHWLPPGVFGPECVPGRYNPAYECDVAFVGSWQHYGHEEWWPQRKRLLNFLKATYGRRVRFFPERGQPAVRGQALNDLYATAKVIIGDSCFADRSRAYFSDRITETMGRGGFLIAPHIPILSWFFHDGEHLRLYEHGDFAQLKSLIDHYLAHDDEREQIRAAGQEKVRAEHTYELRVEHVIRTLAECGDLPA